MTGWRQQVIEKLDMKKVENGGLNEKGRKSYEREPHSDLKAPSKEEKRREMKGMRIAAKLLMIVYQNPYEHGTARRLKSGNESSWVVSTKIIHKE